MDLINSTKIFFGEGSVWHSRRCIGAEPAGFFGKLSRKVKLNNEFRYPIFNLLLPVTKIDSVSYQLKKKNISIDSKDYLDSKEEPLIQNIKKFLQEEFEYSCDQVWLQTLPKMFGYVFNPVSFWYCFKNGKLDAALCEVNNTFGDRHFYFINNLADGNETYKLATKNFHVSPFFDVSGYYRFKFSFFENENQVQISLFDSGNNLKLDTIIKLRFRDFEDVSINYILKKFGWITVMVVWRIHFQALKLWLKGFKFYSRPNPPNERKTYAIPSS